MTNKELTNECSRRLYCPDCKFNKKECDRFMKKNNGFVPAGIIGKVMTTPDGKIFRFNKDFLEREVGK